MKEGLSNTATTAIIAVVLIVLIGVMYSVTKPRDQGESLPQPNAAPSVAPPATVGSNSRPNSAPGASASMAPPASR